MQHLKNPHDFIEDKEERSRNQDESSFVFMHVDVHLNLEVGNLPLYP
jgi:hypothetical protein